MVQAVITAAEAADVLEGAFRVLLVVVAVLNLLVVPGLVWLVGRRTDRMGRHGLRLRNASGWNPWAVGSVLLAFCAPGAPALITGLVALRELRYSDERGKGLARAGVVLGWVWVAVIPAVLGYQLLVAPYVEAATDARIVALTEQVEQLQEQLRDGTGLDDLAGTPAGP